LVSSCHKWLTDIDVHYKYNVHFVLVIMDIYGHMEAIANSTTGLYVAGETLLLDTTLSD